MEQIAIKTTCTGTREWSDVSHNIGSGCSHGCRYCYAASNALTKGYIKTQADWLVEKMTPRRIPTKPGIVMFPTAHDISPYYLDASVKTIQELLEAGSEVLIVTKAHASCIKRICDDFEDYKNQLVIRITIGSMDKSITDFWEPYAPSPIERFIALGYAFLRGYKTSVSMEPMLHGTDDALNTYHIMEPYVTDHIWIGKMNSPVNRVDTSISENSSAVGEIIELQSDTEILKLYNELKEEVKVRWKDSIQTVVARNQK